MPSSALMGLSAQLDSDDTLTVLAAAWDVFTLAAQLSSAITFEEGSDELQAMIATQKCIEGRSRLPLPTTGEPVPAPDPAPGAAALTPYVQLLKHVGRSLTHLAATAEGSEEGKHSLVLTSELAEGAAAALVAVRGH
ncbi:hypothetical protein AB0B01_17330 [Streptomyces sp. NPDC044571]|uniref:hypothetical protein n=1 Tax=Streptomyces sp. NPDC044571 TaxID=3155371 RepID=UPI0033F7CB2E